MFEQLDYFLCVELGGANSRLSLILHISSNLFNGLLRSVIKVNFSVLLMSLSCIIHIGSLGCFSTGPFPALPHFVFVLGMIILTNDVSKQS